MYDVHYEQKLTTPHTRAVSFGSNAGQPRKQT